MGFKKDVWLEMFRYATEKDYAFLYLNAKKPKRLRCMLNFDRVLFHKEESEEPNFEEDLNNKTK
jgi:hypothetical protein